MPTPRRSGGTWGSAAGTGRTRRTTRGPRSPDASRPGSQPRHGAASGPMNRVPAGSSPPAEAARVALGPHPVDALTTSGRGSLNALRSRSTLSVDPREVAALALLAAGRLPHLDERGLARVDVPAHERDARAGASAATSPAAPAARGRHAVRVAEDARAGERIQRRPVRRHRARIPQRRPHGDRARHVAQRPSRRRRSRSRAAPTASPSRNTTFSGQTSLWVAIGPPSGSASSVDHVPPAGIEPGDRLVVAAQQPRHAREGLVAQRPRGIRRHGHVAGQVRRAPRDPARRCRAASGTPSNPAARRCRSSACTAAVCGPAGRRTVSPTRTTAPGFATPPSSGIS